MIPGKRKKNIKKECLRDNKNIERWESDYYESFKDSENSVYESEESETEELNKRKSKKKLKLNFKSKVLKSEKKSNLIKLNLNLKQIVFDEFKDDTLIPNYKNILATLSTDRKPTYCTICYRFPKSYSCHFCNNYYCSSCIGIHQQDLCLK